MSKRDIIIKEISELKEYHKRIEGIVIFNDFDDNKISTLMYDMFNKLLVNFVKKWKDVGYTITWFIYENEYGKCHFEKDGFIIDDVESYVDYILLNKEGVG